MSDFEALIEALVLAPILTAVILGIGWLTGRRR